MSYRARITWAVGLSLVLHAALIPILGTTRSQVVTGPIPARSEPLVVALNPPQERPMRRLIEGGAPAQDTPKPTDLISNRDTQAQDQSEKSGAVQPDAGNPSDFDELAAPQIQPLPSSPPPSPPPSPPEPKVEPKPETEAEQPPSETVEEPASSTPEESTEPAPLEAIEPTEPEPVVAPTTSRQETRSEKAAPNLPESMPTPEPLPERFDVAKADAPLPPRTAELGIVRGREGGGADRKGDLSFEASKHAMADYMLTVRRKVERTWRSALQFRYSGTSTVAAVLECTISPDGRVVDVTILERGDSFVYASLCKQAIERAAPFEPFPFELPSTNREENLVIRWKFTYM